MRTMQSLLDEYGESHRNPTNKLVHWICVPIIFFSVVGLLYSVKLGGLFLAPDLPFNLAMVTLLL
ncbi:MAG: Mpo1-like protein, partial [Saprospiraceae bacterium]